VNDVSLAIERGEFICIMGPSGSGKSSLLYLLGLLDVPTSGLVWLDGEETSRYGEDDLANRRLEKLGFVFQFHFLLAEFSVIDNVTLPIRRLGRLDQPAARACAVWSCWIGWASSSREPSTRTNSRAGSASVSPSPAPWPMTR
jgi:lipoprotein-releasing system ATP-binding protein